MTKSNWTEHLKCPRCGKTGDAELSQIGDFDNKFDSIPPGFKVATSSYGADFYCETCDIPVAP